MSYYFENNYFGRNTSMHKNELFLLKNCKNRPALGDLPPDIRWPLAALSPIPSPSLKILATLHYLIMLYAGFG